jgi:hypothetical protein
MIGGLPVMDLSHLPHTTLFRPEVQWRALCHDRPHSYGSNRVLLRRHYFITPINLVPGDRFFERFFPKTPAETSRQHPPFDVVVELLKKRRATVKAEIIIAIDHLIIV